VEELPSLDKLNRDYGDKDLQVLLINMKEKPLAITSFMEKHRYSSRVLLDLDGEVARKYDVLGIPVSYLIDKDGKMVYRFVGYVDWDSKEIRSLVNNLMNDKRA
jgi:peroxiredoxin